MIVRIIELLEGALKVRNHLLDLFPTPAVLTLKDIDGKATMCQYFGERIRLINLVHILSPQLCGYFMTGIFFIVL